jgi:hypothetical protein
MKTTLVRSFKALLAGLLFLGALAGSPKPTSAAPCCSVCDDYCAEYGLDWWCRSCLAHCNTGC